MKEFINFNDFKETELYKIAQALPKGVLLRAHFGAIVNMIKFINFLKINNKDIYNYIYYVSDYDKVNNFLEFIRTVNHIYFWYRVDQNVDEIKLNESHRVDFILNTIEEQTFAKLVWNNYSSNRLTIAIRDVVDMLYQAAHDIINEIYSDIYKISKDPNKWQAKIRDNTSSDIIKMNEFLDKKLDSIKQLTIYYNKCINKVYNRFKTGKKILLINPKNLNYLSTNRIVSEANLEEYFFSD